MSPDDEGYETMIAYGVIGYHFTRPYPNKFPNPSGVQSFLISKDQEANDYRFLVSQLDQDLDEEYCQGSNVNLNKL